jgi:ribosomal-protein-alanine N-acetyltransferase
MSALPARHDRPAATRLRAMQLDDLPRVLDIEARCYSHPWTRGNFIDSLAAGYLAEVLWATDAGADDALVGYFVAMVGVDELHLLNLTVAPRWQRLGHAQALLDALEQHCRERAAPALLLEVRQGNERARQVYRRRGFAEMGLRRGYYPAGHGRREDAVVMSLAVPALPT